MALKDTIEWARTEWGIITKGDQMTLTERARWLRQWVPFGARTVGYGAVSVTLGPMTREHGASLWAMRRWCRSAMEGLRLAADASGLHHVPTRGGFMYASNHQSLLDILVLGAVLPGDFKWAAKRSLMRIPFLGWHLKLSGHVPVDRQAGRRAAAQVIDRFEQVMREGKPLLVFPEGTRSPDGEVQEFKNGGFYAAVRAGCPVVPVGIDGTGQTMQKGAVDTGEVAPSDMRRIVIRLGEPIYPAAEGRERQRVEELRDRTRDAVVALHREARGARLESP